MELVMQMFRRLWSALRRNRLDTELAEEIELHLELRRQSLIEQGLPPADADRQARRRFGNVTRIRQRSRDEWGGAAMDAVVGDLRFALRTFRHRPGSSAAVVATIALGAGINAALFVSVNNMLLRAPNIPDAEQVVWLDEGRPLRGPSYPDYADYRGHAAGAMTLAAYAPWDFVVRSQANDSVRPLRAVLASGNYFDVLRTRPALGRAFGDMDDRPPSGIPNVVLSDAYWTRAFNRDPGILGQTIEINFKPFTIIGVLPAGFSGARAPNGNPYVPDAWIPIWCLPSLEPGSTRLVDRTSWWGLQAIGRLHEGVSLAQARGQVAAAAAVLDRAYAGARQPRTPWVSRVTDFDPRIVGTEQGLVFGVLAGTAMCVLLIACANVAGVLLARASARRQETAVRLSLGAGRVRVIRQFLAEGFMLALAGTAAGCVAAIVILQWVIRSGSSQAIAWSPLPDGRSLLFAAILAIVATISTGLMPALQASRTALLPALTRAEGRRIGSLRKLLLGMEVAVSVVLVLATALLVRAVIRAQAIDPGFAIGELLTVDIDAHLHGYEGSRLGAALRAVRQEIESLPGVMSTATATPPPFNGNRSGTMVRLAEAGDVAGVRVFLADVSSSFLTTSGLQLVRGRWIDEQQPDEVVVNETLATQLWPNTDPIGARITSRDFNRQSHVVVGIVRNSAYLALREQNVPFMFRPGTSGTLLVRTSGPAAMLTRAAATAAARVDRRFAASTHTLAQQIADELNAARAMTLVAGGIGLLALFVAVAGIAAAAAQAVALRTREIGVRMALGASRQDVVTLIVRESLTPAVIGGIVGVTIASQASRVLTMLLYGVSRFDPLAIAGGLTVLLAATTVAAWLPARRAASIDPAHTLRSE